MSFVTLLMDVISSDLVTSVFLTSSTILEVKHAELSHNAFAVDLPEIMLQPAKIVSPG